MRSRGRFRITWPLLIQPFLLLLARADPLPEWLSADATANRPERACAVVVTIEQGEPHIDRLPNVVRPRLGPEGRLDWSAELQALKTSYSVADPNAEKLLELFTPHSGIRNYDFLFPRLLEIGGAIELDQIGVRDVCDNLQILCNMARLRFFSSDFLLWFDAWTRIDPDNGLPYYQHAGWLMLDARDELARKRLSGVYWSLVRGNRSTCVKLRDVFSRVVQECPGLLDKFELQQASVQSEVSIRYTFITHIGKLVELPSLIRLDEDGGGIAAGELLSEALIAFDRVSTMDGVTSMTFSEAVRRSLVLLENAGALPAVRKNVSTFDALLKRRNRLQIEFILAMQKRGSDVQESGEFRRFQDRLLANTAEWRKLLCPDEGETGP